MGYDFATPVDRRGTWSVQWDGVADRFGVEGLLPFTISDMDFACAPEVLDALHRRVTHGVFGYTDWRHEDFLSAVRHWFATRYGTEIDTGRIVYGPSVLNQLSQLLRMWTEPGDGIVVHTPTYDGFLKAISGLGRELRGAPVGDTAALERQLARPGSKVLLLCSPHNPTGRVWTEAELTYFAQLAAGYGVAVISDEIHADFVHPDFLPADGSPPAGSVPSGSASAGSVPSGSASAGSVPSGSAPAGSAPGGFLPNSLPVDSRLPDVTTSPDSQAPDASSPRGRAPDGHLPEVPHHLPWTRFASGRWALITSATKAFNFPALSGAYGIIGDQDDHAAFVNRMATGEGLASPAVLSLTAHIAAYREGGPWLDALNAYLEGNLRMVRDRLDDAFPHLGWQPPQAGYLAWIDLRPLGVDDGALQRELIEREKVAIMPGSTYGADGFVRFNVGCPAVKAEQGTDALIRALVRLTR